MKLFVRCAIPFVVAAVCIYCNIVGERMGVSVLVSALAFYTAKRELEHDR